MIEIIKTPGKHINYSTTKKNIILGADEDLSINLQSREKDEDVYIDICADENGELTMGTAAGMRYIAEIRIPARKYVESKEPTNGESDEQYTYRLKSMPFNINDCTIYLWGMEE